MKITPPTDQPNTSEQVPRWTPSTGDGDELGEIVGVMIDDPNGLWVHYHDHAAALHAAEAERDKCRDEVYRIEAAYQRAVTQVAEFDARIAELEQQLATAKASSDAWQHNAQMVAAETFCAGDPQPLPAPPSEQEADDAT